MSDTIRRATYYYATVPHRPGEGARVLGAFRDAGVNFLAVHAFPEGDGAQIDLFPEDPEALHRAAEATGIELTGPRTAFLLGGRDRAGVMADVLGKLAGAGLNATALDAVATEGVYGGILWVDQEDVDGAAAALGAN